MSDGDNDTDVRDLGFRVCGVTIRINFPVAFLSPN